MQYKVTTNEPPSFLNKEAALGALIGTLAGGWLFLPAVVIGGVIGAQMGKARMEREYHEGKIVKEPSFWNMKTAIGGLVGHGVGILGSMAVAGILGVSLLTPLGAGIALLGALAGTVAGVMKGGEVGRSEMQREYTDASAQYTGTAPAPGVVVQYDNTPTRNFAETITAEREKAASQQNIHS